MDLNIQTDAGHVVQRQMIRDDGQRICGFLSVELMYEKDKATELCHVLHTGSLFGCSAAGGRGVTDAQSKEAYPNEGQSPPTPRAEGWNIFIQKNIYFFFSAAQTIVTFCMS